MKLSETEIRAKLAEGYQFFKKVMWEDTYVAFAIENEAGIHFFNCSEEDCDYRCDLFENEAPNYLVVTSNKQIARIDEACYRWKMALSIGNSTCWTKGEDSYLRKNYKKLHPLTICLHLNKTYQAIKIRANSFGIKKKKAGNHLFEELKNEAA